MFNNILFNILSLFPAMLLPVSLQQYAISCYEAIDDFADYEDWLDKRDAEFIENLELHLDMLENNHI